MRAIVTVIGKDRVGINAMVSGGCAKHGVNIVDITQSVLSEYFAMIVLAEIDSLNIPFSQFADALAASGKELGLDIRAMHEDIFNTMHHV